MSEYQDSNAAGSNDDTMNEFSDFLASHHFSVASGLGDSGDDSGFDGLDYSHARGNDPAVLNPLPTYDFPTDRTLNSPPLAQFEPQEGFQPLADLYQTLPRAAPIAQSRDFDGFDFHLGQHQQPSLEQSAPGGFGNFEFPSLGQEQQQGLAQPYADMNGSAAPSVYPDPTPFALNAADNAFPALDAHNSGFPPFCAHDNGFSVPNAYNSGFPALDAHNNGFPTLDVHNNGFPAVDAHGTGFLDTSAHDNSVPAFKAFESNFPAINETRMPVPLSVDASPVIVVASSQKPAPAPAPTPTPLATRPRRSNSRLATPGYDFEAHEFVRNKKARPGHAYREFPGSLPAWGTAGRPRLFCYKPNSPVLDPDLTYTRDELYHYLTQNPRRPRIWVQNPPSQMNHRIPTKESKCRWKNCPNKSRAIVQGFYRVAFDEFPRQTGDGNFFPEKNVDPFHMAGYMHLACFEELFSVTFFYHVPLPVNQSGIDHDESLVGERSRQLHGDFRTFTNEARGDIMSLLRSRETGRQAMSVWLRGQRRLPLTGINAQAPEHSTTLGYHLNKNFLALDTPAHARSRNARNEGKNDNERLTRDTHNGNLRLFQTRMQRGSENRRQRLRSGRSTQAQPSPERAAVQLPRVEQYPFPEPQPEPLLELNGHAAPRGDNPDLSPTFLQQLQEIENNAQQHGDGSGRADELDLLSVAAASTAGPAAEAPASVHDDLAQFFNDPLPSVAAPPSTSKRPIATPRRSKRARKDISVEHHDPYDASGEDDAGNGSDTDYQNDRPRASKRLRRS